jgi:hypothetical protein
MYFWRPATLCLLIYGRTTAHHSLPRLLSVRKETW